jgi:hypothetical protein
MELRIQVDVASLLAGDLPAKFPKGFNGIPRL